ncbi:hypothetical protein [Streptomyces lydicus]|uniref:hypothetical protein n=1 Tax=Streptomyces lydicus TaxID=47763 RepID=UPI0013E92783|nr:hypothetical protein [Streptomyces lydicus]
MGVFSRFRRRRSEASAEELSAAAVTAGAERPAEVEEPAEGPAGAVVPEAAEAAGAGAAGEAADSGAEDSRADEGEAAAPGPAAPEASGGTAAEAAAGDGPPAEKAGEKAGEKSGESAGIPRQQSAEAAADSESARQ